jgi:antitoxin component HigA of HigAB toxin-antitoxin module
LVLANVVSAYSAALDVLTVTFVAGLVVVPATVSAPLLVTVESSFKLLTPKFCSSVLFVRKFKLPAASDAVFTRLNAEQRDYLDVLTKFVDEYDKGKKIRWPKVSGLDALKHLMEANQMSAADLSRLLGTIRNLGAMILRGGRQLTLVQVCTLAKRFNVSADLFLP